MKRLFENDNQVQKKPRGRPRKNPVPPSNPATPAVPVPSTASYDEVPPVKRGRGRPRKTPLSLQDPAPAPAPATSSSSKDESPATPKNPDSTTSIDTPALLAPPGADTPKTPAVKRGRGAAKKIDAPTSSQTRPSRAARPLSMVEQSSADDDDDDFIPISPRTRPARPTASKMPDRNAKDPTPTPKTAPPPRKPSPFRVSKVILAPPPPTQPQPQQSSSGQSASAALGSLQPRPRIVRRAPLPQRIITVAPLHSVSSIRFADDDDDLPLRRLQQAAAAEGDVSDLLPSHPRPLPRTAGVCEIGFEANDTSDSLIGMGQTGAGHAGAGQPERTVLGGNGGMTGGRLPPPPQSLVPRLTARNVQTRTIANVLGVTPAPVAGPKLPRGQLGFAPDRGVPALQQRDVTLRPIPALPAGARRVIVPAFVCRVARPGVHPHPLARHGLPTLRHPLLVTPLDRQLVGEARELRMPMPFHPTRRDARCAGDRERFERAVCEYVAGLPVEEDKREYNCPFELLNSARCRQWLRRRDEHLSREREWLERGGGTGEEGPRAPKRRALPNVIKDFAFLAEWQWWDQNHAERKWERLHCERANSARMPARLLGRFQPRNADRFRVQLHLPDADVLILSSTELCYLWTLSDEDMDMEHVDWSRYLHPRFGTFLDGAETPMLWEWDEYSSVDESGEEEEEMEEEEDGGWEESIAPSMEISWTEDGGWRWPSEAKRVDIGMSDALPERIEDVAREEESDDDDVVILSDDGTRTSTSNSTRQTWQKVEGEGVELQRGQECEEGWEGGSGVGMEEEEGQGGEGGEEQEREEEHWEEEEEDTQVSEGSEPRSVRFEDMSDFELELDEEKGDEDEKMEEEEVEEEERLEEEEESYRDTVVPDSEGEGEEEEQEEEDPVEQRMLEARDRLSEGRERGQREEGLERTRQNEEKEEEERQQCRCEKTFGHSRSCASLVGGGETGRRLVWNFGENITSFVCNCLEKDELRWDLGARAERERECHRHVLDGIGERRLVWNMRGRKGGKEVGEEEEEAPQTRQQVRKPRWMERAERTVGREAVPERDDTSDGERRGRRKGPPPRTISVPLSRGVEGEMGSDEARGGSVSSTRRGEEEEGEEQGKEEKEEEKEDEEQGEQEEMEGEEEQGGEEEPHTPRQVRKPRWMERAERTVGRASRERERSEEKDGGDTEKTPQPTRARRVREEVETDRSLVKTHPSGACAAKRPSLQWNWGGEEKQDIGEQRKGGVKRGIEEEEEREMEKEEVRPTLWDKRGARVVARRVQKPLATATASSSSTGEEEGEDAQETAVFFAGRCMGGKSGKNRKEKEDTRDETVSESVSDADD